MEICKSCTQCGSEQEQDEGKKRGKQNQKRDWKFEKKEIKKY